MNPHLGYNLLPLLDLSVLLIILALPVIPGFIFHHFMNDDNQNDLHNYGYTQPKLYEGFTSFVRF